MIKQIDLLEKSEKIQIVYVPRRFYITINTQYEI